MNNLVPVVSCILSVHSSPQLYLLGSFNVETMFRLFNIDITEKCFFLFLFIVFCIGSAVHCRSTRSWYCSLQRSSSSLGWRKKADLKVRFKPQYSHTNSSYWSPYISWKNWLREFDRRSNHISFGDYFSDPKNVGIKTCLFENFNQKKGSQKFFSF